MAGVSGPNSRYLQSATPIWPLAGEDLAIFTLGVWGGGGSRGVWGTTCYEAVFQPQQLRNGRPFPLFEVPCLRQ